MADTPKTRRVLKRMVVCHRRTSAILGRTAETAWRLALSRGDFGNVQIRLDSSGCVRAVISTHFRNPHRPSELDAPIMAWYAENVALVLADDPRGILKESRGP
jgi:hypothetical protein